jgi:hypothetical protein
VLQQYRDLNDGIKTIQDLRTPVLAVGVSNITYARGVFPEAAYARKSLDRLPVRVLKERNDHEEAGTLASYLAGAFDALERIFSRVSNRDCIETNSSTFMVEMQETSFILANVGPTSLVIIDELGRGTSVDEGSAICWAVERKYLKELILVMHLDPADPDTAFEMYTFR